jgi:uncharacterized protein (TIGR03437 family)
VAQALLPAALALLPAQASEARPNRPARFTSAVRPYLLDLNRNFLWLVALPLCGSVCQAADIPGRPLAVQQTSYEMRVGESAQIAATAETLDFLLTAKSLRADLDGIDAGALAVGPNRVRDRIMLAAPLRIKPGHYTATLSATSAAGERRVSALSIVVKPRQQVPTGSTQPPVVLLNGWETAFTGTCNISSSSADTFGNLAAYLASAGVPVVYFFDNCAVDPNQTIETLGNDLGAYLNTIQYTNGDQVPQIDLVAFSMGGLIARAYLAGLQPSDTATPPATTLVRDLILIATPNFGSFVAGNYATTLAAYPGTQDAELIPGSSFLWNLATWNQRGDDLRGVNALAIVGNAAPYLGSLEATSQLNNASDGLVSETSAALGFVLTPTSTAAPTQVVPYCHVDPVDFTNTALLGTFNCDAAGIANVTSETQETGEIVLSFLAGTSDWQSIGVSAAKDPWLSIDGGMFFGMQDQSGVYVTDLTAVEWGTVELTPGGDTDVIYYTDFVNGTGDYLATSTSLSTINCGSLAEALGYFSSARCKLDTAIYDVTPVSAPGWTVPSGSTITITGNDFAMTQCNSCQVLATPVSTGTQTALQVSSWTKTAITAALPASMTGLVTIQVIAVPGTDAITIMAAAPTAVIATAPASLQFAYTAGGAVPAAQSIQITNSGTGTLTWTAAASDSWLSVTPASGTAPTTLSVSVSPASLTAGTYNGSVTITAAGASNTPLTVGVTLTVAAAVVMPTLTAAPQSLTFNYTVGGAAPAAQSVAIANAGSGTLSWTASSSVFWASLSAASGSAPATLSVTVNPANLAAGSYAGNVQIAAAGATGSPVSIALALVVKGTQAAGNITAVTNAGSFQSGFASATWVSIFGTNLSASTEIWNGSDFVNGVLPTSLDGVSVTFNGIPAYVYFISPTQMNVLAPDDPATGAVQVQVTAAGQKSNSFTAQKQPYSPSWFTFDNGKYVAALHNSNYGYVGAPGLLSGVTTTPAQPGEVVLLYGTGFGPTDPATPTGQLVTTAEPLPADSVQITIGGVAANVIFAGITESGLYQFDVTVPSGLPSGDAAVVATIGGLQTQAGVSLTIQ